MINLLKELVEAQKKAERLKEKLIDQIQDCYVDPTDEQIKNANELIKYYLDHQEEIELVLTDQLYCNELRHLEDDLYYRGVSEIEYCHG